MVSTAFFLSSQMSALADCLAYRRRWMDDHEELSALPNYHMRQEDRETASTYKFKPSCTGPSIDACSTSSHMLIDGSVTGLPGRKDVVMAGGGRRRDSHCPCCNSQVVAGQVLCPRESQTSFLHSELGIILLVPLSSSGHSLPFSSSGQLIVGCTNRLLGTRCSRWKLHSGSRS